ncbi:helix-hairpin-helix domain-containing protein [Algoriphagus aestuariicola]|uniref:Helix-hairpin-helix domain-containing protein n=1 Tax=Algoriphagus aestuariicola TaxID=1852016 RepID=A0ABS3BN28_9BACT|nr:helix-hairpin-helix domain-containing protein [Algoriphagus aestuariicola]MBN7799740.1 helix-hairpin-helix domain-containing protein [Algoriphagus aestuariicola]
MKERVFYWMKFYLGFSGKESRGFLVLIPVLLVFGLLPNAIRYYKDKQASGILTDYRFSLDSMENLDFKLTASPLPTFNPMDTVKSSRNQRQLENINRIPFSQADSVTLQIVPGIGPGTASRIIKYRQQLGGFHSQEQLLEVYGLTEDLASTLWEFFEFDSLIFKKIPANSATIEEFSAHPYISYGEAKVLVAYRKQHGEFLNTDELLNIKIFKLEWVQKIKPYLDLSGN